MTGETLTWFALQAIAAAAAFAVGRHVARQPARVWKPVAVAATCFMLGWPLMRVWPARTLMLLGSAIVIHIEVTGIVVPAALLFAIAARHVRQPRESRVIYLLLVVCGLYFVRNGSWMVTPPIGDLGMTRFSGDVCRQSTGYTCVPASLVTLLKVRGIDATETEMARLSHVRVNQGTTDSRAVRALEVKLADRPLRVRYEVMDYDRLCDVPKPCLVSTKWGYFVSHMMPVLSADDELVVLGDPLVGRRALRTEAFLDVWHKSGIYVEPPTAELVAR